MSTQETQTNDDNNNNNNAEAHDVHSASTATDNGFAFHNQNMRTVEEPPISEPLTHQIDEDASVTVPTRATLTQPSTAVNNPVRDSVSPATSNKADSSFLSFKDQVRPYQMIHTTAEDQAEVGVNEYSAPQDRGPTFKDQVRGSKNRDEPAQVQAHGAVAVGSQRSVEESGSTTSPPDVPLIRAHLVESTINLPTSDSDESVVMAQAFALSGQILVHRKTLLLIAAMVLVAAVVVGGVCGSGLCGSSSSSSSSSVEPPTGSLTEPQLSAPSSVDIPKDSVSQAVLNFINNITLRDEPITFPVGRDEATPENLAVQWLVQSDPWNLTTDDSVELTQRYALALFYFSTNGEDWINNDKWLTEERECNWYGTYCFEPNKANIVTGLDMRMNRLNGSIPADIALLQSLTMLNFAVNPHLSGPIPASIGNLMSLVVFYCYDCRLTGTLSDELGSLQNMTRLSLSNGLLTGTLPSSIGQWTAIREININDNDFSGSLPDSIENWSSLYWIYAQRNNISGTLPSGIGAWTALEEIQVQDNSLSGTLPDSVGNWTALIYIDASYNNLNGTIPESIVNWNWGYIDEVRLDGNHFTGTFPSDLCYLPVKFDPQSMFVAVDCDLASGCPCCSSCPT